MKKWENVKKELLKNKKVAQEYQKLAPRYQLISELIKIRIKKGLTQDELAKKINTKQSAIARLESGSGNPSLATLEKIIKVMDVQLRLCSK